ncbi:MAG: hypothetical protein ACI89X_000662 [Planctomycetota bacterium]|jgi:hypothetical protein
MSGDDYLHDPGAERDPEIAALEDALRPLRLTNSTPTEHVLAAAPARRVWPWLVTLTWAAAAAAAMWLWLSSDALYPGCDGRSFVCEKAEMRVDLGDLAVITLQPGSELQFVHWRKDEQALFRLKRGGIRAVVVPPPRVKAGFFVVESPRGTVVDQGCAYELVIDKNGVTRVYVEAGAVTFTNQELTVWVPAGARAAVGPEGVRTPTFIAAAPVIKQLVARIDELRHSKNPKACNSVVAKLVAECSEPGDTLPLWHLLDGGDLVIAKEATQGLFRLVGSPDGKSGLRMFPADEWLRHLREVAW